MSRTRTPPGLKWALNQRALVAGQAAKLRLQLQELQPRLEKAEAEMAALDRTIAVLNASVRPDVLGVVNAWQGRYGQRGALKAFLEQRLRDVGSEGATTPELTHAAQEAFGLQFETPEEWQAFRHHSVRNQLRRWHAVGDVTMNYEMWFKKKVARWRWKQGPTLADLVEAERRARGGT